MKTNDTPKIKGEATLTLCNVSTWHAKLSEKAVQAAAKLGPRWYRAALAYHHARYMTRQVRVANLVVDDGLNLLAQAIIGTSMEINFVALGDNATAAVAGDTQLQNETSRKAPSSTTSSGASAFVSTFFTATEAVDTHEEVGHFSGATSTANSGTLFSRIASPDTSELPVTKTNTDSLTIDYKVTIST